MKRGLPETAISPEDGEPTKFPKIEKGNLVTAEDPNIESHVRDLIEVQAEIRDLDNACAKEQIVIQKQYDEKKKTWFEKRQQIISKVPGFWGCALARHPVLSYMSQDDTPILEYLERIDLEDNIDDNGSYRTTFAFNEKAKEFFEPLVITKEVKFDQYKEPVEECTEIHWKPGKNPIDKAIMHRQADENSDCWSIFEWFTKQTDDERDEVRVDIGEVIRRDLWHSPLPYYLGINEAEYEDEDFGDDEDAVYGDENDDEDEVEEDDGDDGDDDGADADGN